MTNTTTTSTTTTNSATTSSTTTSSGTVPNKEAKPNKDIGSSATEDGGSGAVKVESGTSAAQTKANKPPATPAGRSEDSVIVNKPPAHFVNYYLQIARVIIVCSNENHLRVCNCFFCYLYSTNILVFF